MDALDAEIRQGGALAVGPGHYALGRGWLALGDDARAREHLEIAWREGSREPRVAHALALVMGHLYQARLLEVESLQSAPLREARRRELEREYRDPALEWLRRGEGAEVASPEYMAALIAFYETRYPGSWAAAYLHDRFGQDLTGHPGIRPGFAPAGWTTLVTHLRRHGVTEQTQTFDDVRQGIVPGIEEHESVMLTLSMLSDSKTTRTRKTRAMRAKMTQREMMTTKTTRAKKLKLKMKPRLSKSWRRHCPGS